MLVAECCQGRRGWSSFYTYMLRCKAIQYTEAEHIRSCVGQKSQDTLDLAFLLPSVDPESAFALSTSERDTELQTLGDKHTKQPSRFKCLVVNSFSTPPVRRQPLPRASSSVGNVENGFWSVDRRGERELSQAPSRAPKRCPKRVCRQNPRPDRRTILPMIEGRRRSIPRASSSVGDVDQDFGYVDRGGQREPNTARNRAPRRQKR